MNDISLTRFLQNTPIRHLVYKMGLWRSQRIVKLIRPYIRGYNIILDIGAGTCIVSEVLRQEGKNIIPSDIENLSFAQDTFPVICNGEFLPFATNQFDLSLLLSVLHHTHYPEKILLEAKRVSKKIVIIEDIYSSLAGKLLTHFADSLFNLEFTEHPHMNLTDEKWKICFDRLGMHLIHSCYNREMVVFSQGIYYLENRS